MRYQEMCHPHGQSVKLKREGEWVALSSKDVPLVLQAEGRAETGKEKIKEQIPGSKNGIGWKDRRSQQTWE